MTIHTVDGDLPHIKWIDIKGDGILTECAIMKTDQFGNIFFFEVNHLDAIDKKRLVRLINNRDSGNYELWDLMSQVTLNNGVNALEYFHQMVKVISPDGVIYSPKSGVVGSGKVDTNNTSEVREAVHRQTAVASNKNATSPNKTAESKTANSVVKKASTTRTKK